MVDEHKCGSVMLLMHIIVVAMPNQEATVDAMDGKHSLDYMYIMYEVCTIVLVISSMTAPAGGEKVDILATCYQCDA